MYEIRRPDTPARCPVGGPGPHLAPGSGKMNGMPAIPLRRALTLFVALAAVLTVLAACTSSKATSTTGSTGGGAAGGTSSTAGVGSVKWQSCNIGGLLGAGLKCASLSVPLNYSDPNGRKITLALSEVPATAPASQRLGDLLVNPGGPGASGRSLAASGAQGLSSDVAGRDHIIGFDPRGAGGQGAVPGPRGGPGAEPGRGPPVQHSRLRPRRGRRVQARGELATELL